MTRRHLTQVLAVDPTLSDRTELLRPNGDDIADPYGLSLEEYRAARDEIAAALEARSAEWR
jgi:protein-tyrosine-phosphatase